jgi:hypothetical protein
MSHKGFSHSGLSSCFTRNLIENDARMQARAEISIRRLGLTGAAGAPTPVESAKAG